MNENKNLNTQKNTSTANPEPLFRELPQSAEFPDEALGPVLAGALEAISKTIQAPRALIGQSLLAAASLAVQPFVNVLNDGRHSPLSLFAITIGKSGERKSAVDKNALAPHREVEKENIEQYKIAYDNYKRTLLAYEVAKKKALGGRKTPEQILKALEDLGMEPQPPLSENMLLEEPTYEATVKNYEEGRPSLGVFSDEGGRFIGGHGMNQENQLKTATGFSSLWDGSSISRSRKGDGTIKLYGKRMALHLMLQYGPALILLSNKLIQEQGLLARCLITYPESTIGTRLYLEHDLRSDPQMKKYSDLMTSILRTKMPMKKENANELSPRDLPLDADAKAVWIVFHNYIEKEMRTGGKFSQITAFGSKAPEQALRIAGILTLLENLDAPCIKLNHLHAAICLIEYYLTEVLRLHGSSSIDSNLIAAQELLEWCQVNHQKIWPSLILQYGPNHLRDIETIRKLISILESHGWLINLGSKKIDGNIHKEVWGVVHESK